jgi:hypothetical protein
MQDKSFNGDQEQEINMAKKKTKKRKKPRKKTIWEKMARW